MTLTTKTDMDIYSIDKLMHETRQLAARYRQATGSILPVTGEIARFDAAKALDLRLVDDPNVAYDAIGSGAREDKRVIIKGRAIFETTRSAPRIGQINPEQDWDLAVLVLFDDQYQAREIYEASNDDIAAALTAKISSSRKKRGAMSVARFKIIGDLVWTHENGLEPEIWDNQSE